MEEIKNNIDGDREGVTSKTLIDVDDLLYDEYLRPFSDTINAHYSAGTMPVYRSVKMPATIKDLLPRKLRKFEALADALDNYELPELDDLSDAERLKVLNHYFGSSVFTNEDGLRAMWTKGYMVKKSPSDKNRYIADMGDSMVRLLIDGIKDGVLQNEIRESDGHLNFLPSKDFNIEEHIDREYGINGYKPLIDLDL